jgi:hypothetical protein
MFLRYCGASNTLSSVEPPMMEFGPPFHFVRDRVTQVPNDIGTFISVYIDGMNVASAEHAKEHALCDACFLLPLCFRRFGVNLDWYIGGGDPMAVHDGYRLLEIESGEQPTESVHHRRNWATPMFQHHQLGKVDGKAHTVKYPPGCASHVFKSSSSDEHAANRSRDL